MRIFPSTIVNIFVLLTLFSFILAIWVVSYRDNFIWSGILFFISSYVAYHLLYIPDKEEKDKGGNKE